MLTEVILEGEFAKVAGRKVWKLDCNSPSEAIALISANCQGKLKNWIRQNITKYKICEVECESETGNKENLDNDTFALNRQCKKIRFLPIFSGAGGDNGIIQAIVGVAMVVIGVVVGVWAGWTGVGGAFASGMIKAGLGMILGAVATMLIAPSEKSEDDGDNSSSYYFNGAVNTTTQGNPVPLVFGRCRVGSAVISASIDIAEGK